jgi:predicted GTPase
VIPSGGPHWSDADRARIRAAIARLYSDLDARGVTVVGPLDTRLRALSRWLDRGRPPRVAAVGRRGSGKSSLLNALASRELAPTGAIEDTTADARAYELSLGEELSADWIDTPGLRAGGVIQDRLGSIVEVLSDAPPDLIVWAHQASEADAGVDEEAGALRSLLQSLHGTYGWSPQLVAVLTRVDELDPPDEIAPPYDDPTKQANIAAALRAAQRALVRHGLHAVAAVPTTTWFSADSDLRWNIAPLASLLRTGLLSARRDAGAELRELYLRIAQALGALVAHLGRGRPDGERDALRAWFVATVRRMGPVAARIDDDGHRLDRPGPLEWARRGLGAVGAARQADFIERSALDRLAVQLVEGFSWRAPVR